jgi:PAS domain S-box-containing protein
MILSPKRRIFLTGTYFKIEQVMQNGNIEILNHDHAILDSIADGVFTVDRKWTITSFNKAAEAITGVRRRDAVGRRCWEVFHANVCESDCLLKKTLKTNRQCISRTVHIINKKGVSVPISISTGILKNAKGKVIGGVETFRDLSEIEELRKEVLGKHTFGDIVTQDHRILNLFNVLPAIAKSTSPVLILGESGTGKELLAKAIHNASEKANGPFVAVNCGALPENLLESELFGYRKGAFTDAKTDKPGRFDRAKGGTLFLDEIGDLPKSLQVKLLRVIQENMFEPLGSTAPVLSEARIIAATNHDLQQMVESGEFRQDLYYRINVVPIVMPPLRDRKNDIPLLIDHFLMHFNLILKRNIERISNEAMAIIIHHAFPGNVRELENILHHAFILCQGSTIEKKHLPEYLFASKQIASVSPESDSVEAFEKQKIVHTLERNKYSRTRSAKELGVHVATLWRKMKQYGIK